MRGDALASGSRSATFGPAKISQDAWNSIWSKDEWRYFYLWRHDGKPIYIGQSGDPNWRSYRHRHGFSGISFSMFLKEHSECTCEILDVKMWGTQYDSKVRAVEEALIDLYETRMPEGFNTGRLERQKTLKNLPREFKSLGGKNRIKKHGNPATAEGCSSGGKKGSQTRKERGDFSSPEHRLASKRGVHNRCHVARGIKNPSCEFCNGSA